MSNRWSLEEDLLLITFKKRGYSHKEIAVKLDRTIKAINHRTMLLEITKLQGANYIKQKVMAK